MGLADAQPIRATVYPLLKPSPDGSSPGLGDAQLHATLSGHLGPTMTAHRYPGYLIADRSRRIVASSYPTLLGQQDVPEFREFLSRCLDGHTTVSPPFASTVLLPDSTSHARPGQPVMYVAAPLRDEETFQVVGVLALQIRPEREFTEILQLGQYHLEEKLGQGVMGIVYRGHHAMLRRPAAIKMLNIDSVNEASLQTARDLARLLGQCPTAHDWSVVDGDAWWSRHARGSRRPGPAGQPSSPAEYEVDVERTIDQTS